MSPGIRHAQRAAPFVLAAAAAVSCTDPADRAAKARIFSPEEPPKVKLAAAQPIDASGLASSPERSYRVLMMGAAEAVERLGPHRYTCTASFEWRRGKDVVKLSEERALTQAGALDYALKTDNDRAQGLEIIRSAGRVYARTKFGKFRERKRDREQSERLREDTFGALKTAALLLDGRLSLTPAGDESVSGRSAAKYLFALAERAIVPKVHDGANVPPVQFPAGGPDGQTKRRIDFGEKRSARSVEGTLWVDSQTGVPLKAQLTAQIAAPGEGSEEAALTIRINSLIAGIDQKLEVSAPKDFLPDEDRPPGVAAALARFEIARSDAGTAEPTAKPPDSDGPDD
jgi:hypothetical protein